MDENEAGWVEEDDGSYYYYYSDGTMATGWMQSGDDWYYFDDNGKMATGWQSIGGDTYYFYSTGEMATGWVDSGNGWYYLYGNGSMAWGRTVGEYLLDDSGKMVTGTGWKYEDGNSYYLKADKIVTGWLEYGDDNWSYLYGNGTMAWGRTVDGYYLNDDGNWVKSEGWQKEEDNDGNVTWYYVGSDGTAVTGWQKIDDKWYYFDEDGSMAHDTMIGQYYVNADGEWESSEDNSNTPENTNTGWKQNGDDWYYYYSNGQMATGWAQVGDKWYYLDPSSGVMQTGWQNIDGNTYYLGSDGKMVMNQCVWGFSYGWRYLNFGGQLVTNQWIKYNNTLYHTNDNGQMLLNGNNVNPQPTYDVVGTVISACETAAQNAKIVPVTCLNTTIRSSLAELGIFADGFMCLALVSTVQSIISNDKTYSAEEANKLNAVDIASFGLGVVASVVVSGAIPLVIAGLVIGAGAYVIKKEIISSYS